MAQIAAEEFAVPMEKVRVISCDTAITPPDHGTISNRVTFHTGNAVRVACADAKRQIFERVSAILGMPPENLTIEDGLIHKKGTTAVAIKVGDLFVVDEVIRGDGVTPYYVDKDFKTVSDKKISDLLFEIAQGMGLNVHRGKAWTTDALLRETREIVEAKRKEGAKAVDMVSSTLLTICQTYNVKAGSILAVSDNVITGEMGFMNPLYYMAESNLIKIALELVKKIEKG